MLTILSIGLCILLVSFWRAHRTPGFDFNAFDLVMSSGKVDRAATVFMLSFAVMTWIFIDLQLKGKMTEMYFAGYGAIWVAPVLAKVIYNATTMPSSTSVTSMTSTTTTEGK